MKYKNNCLIPTYTTNLDNMVISQRRAKLNALRKNQKVAFPNNFQPTHSLFELHQSYNALDDITLAQTPICVTVAGRIMLKRIMGKASFATIQDTCNLRKQDGRIQLYITKDIVTYNDFKQYDIGDIIGIHGHLFKTKTNELTIKIKNLQLITKSLRPLPDKFHSLSDLEIKYRQRYVDLIMNNRTRSIFKTRTAAISFIRHFMEKHEFMEVETPMLHNIPGGATAKPFVTHHNTLNMQMYLRIAPELYLKRLIVGGFERVFELNRNFRNEGMSSRHNPEFTMMEFYAAYTNYKWIMQFTENIICQVVLDIHGTTTLPYQGKTLNFSKPFARLTISDAIQKYATPNYTNDQLEDNTFLQAELQKLDIQINTKYLKKASLNELQLALFEKTTETQLWDPIYITNYPIEVSPLARESDSIPNIAERFELFIAGYEVANGFSELNDAEDQEKRFKTQALMHSIQNKKTMQYDTDYIRALEYGMPPTAGCGIGIDRLIMLITNSSNIRDVILFPQLRQEYTINT